MAGSTKEKAKKKQSTNRSAQRRRRTVNTTATSTPRKKQIKTSTSRTKPDSKMAERRKQGVPKLEPEEFAQRIVKKNEKGRLELVEKFRRFKAQQVEETRRQKRSAFDANSGKNRFTDVVCGDKGRVILKDRLPGDYIHANFVKLFKEKLAICAQGPKESTALDFWRMIWQEDSKIIVMLCNFQEDNKNKCFQYFAEDLNKEMEFPPFKVTTKEEVTETLGKTTSIPCRLLELRKGTRTKTIHHIHYTTWPDKGIPTTTEPVLKLLNLISTKRQEIARNEPKTRQEDDKTEPKKMEKKNWPITVHCSAGIGRTGTLVTLDICSDILDSEGKVADVASVVRNIRRQRLHAVQTERQFWFIHHALLEKCIRKNLLKKDQVDMKTVTEAYKKM